MTSPTSPKPTAQQRIRPTSSNYRFAWPRHPADPSIAATSARIAKSLPTSPNTPDDMPCPEQETERANADQTFWHGTGGEKRTLLLVARYADACNLFASSPHDVAH